MSDEFEDYQDENEDFQIDAESSDYLHFSEDKRRLVSLCWIAYKYTHTNEDGVAQYAPIAIINGEEKAAEWLDGKGIRYLRIACAPMSSDDDGLYDSMEDEHDQQGGEDNQ